MAGGFSPDPAIEIASMAKRPKNAGVGDDGRSALPVLASPLFAGRGFPKPRICATRARPDDRSSEAGSQAPHRRRNRAGLRNRRAPARSSACPTTSSRPLRAGCGRAHDRARKSIAARQRREILWGKVPPRGAKPAKDNLGTIGKAQVLRAALDRVDAQQRRRAAAALL